MEYVIPDAALISGGYIIDNLQTALVTNIPAVTQIVQVMGYYATGDAGQGVYKRVSVQPAYPGYFQSADGAYWQYCSPQIRIEAFGAKLTDSAHDDTQAIRDAISYAQNYYTKGSNIRYPMLYAGYGNIMTSDLVDLDQCSFQGMLPFCTSWLWTGDAATGIITKKHNTGIRNVRFIVTGANYPDFCIRFQDPGDIAVDWGDLLDNVFLCGGHTASLIIDYGIANAGFSNVRFENSTVCVLVNDDGSGSFNRTLRFYGNSTVDTRSIGGGFVVEAIFKFALGGSSVYSLVWEGERIEGHRGDFADGAPIPATSGIVKIVDYPTKTANNGCLYVSFANGGMQFDNIGGDPGGNLYMINQQSTNANMVTCYHQENYAVQGVDSYQGGTWAAGFTCPAVPTGRNGFLLFGTSPLGSPVPRYFSLPVTTYFGPGGATLTGDTASTLITAGGNFSVTSNELIGATYRFGTGGNRIVVQGAVPSSGTWIKGDVALNGNCSAGGIPGWTCVTGGTPGTWKAWAAVAA